MTKLFRFGALAAMLALPGAAPAAAGDLSLSIANGRVTLIAEDVTIRQILAEWARVGETQIVNGDKMPGGPVTLELRDVPEMKALEIILRSAAGYVVAPRLSGRMGPSAYERVVILATSNPPPPSALPPPTFGPQPHTIIQQMMPPPDTDPGNNQEPANEPPNMMPGATQPGYQPGQQPQPVPGPITADRPGPLPQPAATPGNPFQPGTRPGAPGQPPRRPGGGGVDR